MAIPPFKSYFATLDEMTIDQRVFYKKWLHNWQKGIPIPVEGNISYLFCYTYDLLKRQPSEGILELQRLSVAYSSEEKYIWYCQYWQSDFYILLGDFKSALDVLPSPALNSTSSSLTNRLLSLKLICGVGIEGRDMLTLGKVKVTKWGKENIVLISQYLDVIVKEYEKFNDIDLLKEWANDSHRYSLGVFSGSIYQKNTRYYAFSFDLNENAMSFINDKTRNAENIVREELNLPKVGEGWVSETELFYKLKKAFPNFNVIQHASPEWLGRQHLDIYLPDQGIAIEYQGKQHDEPIEYFGGQEAFDKTKKRDIRKKRLCKRNNVRLIEVREGYDINQLIFQISTAE